MPKKDRYVVLDSWRGISACFVALFHFSAYSHVFNASIVRNSYLFVDFFFVLSGFVISANYAERLGNGFGLGKFMLLRFGRVYPLHLAVLLVFVGWELARLAFAEGMGVTLNPEVFSGFKSLWALATNALLVHSLGIHDFHTWNIPSWSISTEFYAYLVFALIVVAFVRARNSVILIVIAVSVLVLHSLSPMGIGSTYDYGFARCVYGFLIGYFVWLANERLRSRWDDAVPSKHFKLLTIFEIACVGLAYWFVSRQAHTELSILTPFVFAITVLVFVWEGGIISSILKKKFFLFLGMLSYSIYMVHFFIALRIIDSFIVAEILSDTKIIVLSGGRRMITFNEYIGDLLYLPYLGIVVLTAYFTYRIIESPGRAYFRKLAAKLD